MRFSCLHPVKAQIYRSPLSTPITYPARSPALPCSLPSLTKRHSTSPSRILFRIPLHQILCKFKFISLCASLPPNPHLLLLHGPFPTVPLSSKFNQIAFLQICPNSRANNSFLGHTTCHSALSPSHVSPTTPCTSRPPA